MTSAQHRAFSLPLLVTYLSWGYNFVSIKLMWREMSVPSLLLSRWILMIAGMYALCWAAKLPLTISRRELPLVLLQGFLSLGLYMVVFLEGTNRTGPGEAAIVLATAPLMTALLSAAFRQERLRPAMLAWALLAFVGVGMVVLGSGHKLKGNLFGDLLILASAALWAIATVLSKPLVGKHPPITMVTVSMWGALPIILPYSLLPFLSTNWAGLSTTAWGNLFFIAFGAGVFGFACFYVGVKQVGASGTMIYQYMVPPLANLFAWLIMGQTLSPLQWAGFVVAFTGVVMATRARIAGLNAEAASKLEQTPAFE